MSSAHSPTFPSLHLRHSSFSNPSVSSPMSQFILQPFFRFSYVTTSSLKSSAHSPTYSSLHLCHNSFSNLSVALPTSQLILQPFFRFSYFCLRTGLCPLCSVLCYLLRCPLYSADHSFQGVPPLFICVVFWSKVCCSLYRHIIHGYLGYKSRGCNYYRASQILRTVQTAVARGLGLPVGRLAARHTDAAPKHSLLFQFNFRVDGHAHRRTFPKRRR